ncbi:MAG: DUF6477 family protein [Paracoccaceae bacterium]
MKDLTSMIAGLKRPKLLSRAAQIGAQHYRRDTHLRMALDMAVLPRPGQALLILMEIESELNQRRRDRDANYPPARHVGVLIAMLGEVNEMRQTMPRVQ